MNTIPSLILFNIDSHYITIDFITIFPLTLIICLFSAYIMLFIQAKSEFGNWEFVFYCLVIKCDIILSTGNSDDQNYIKESRD
jgi:hypothetical protein